MNTQKWSNLFELENNDIKTDTVTRKTRMVTVQNKSELSFHWLIDCIYENKHWMDWLIDWLHIQKWAFDWLIDWLSTNSTHPKIFFHGLKIFHDQSWNSTGVYLTDKAVQRKFSYYNPRQWAERAGKSSCVDVSVELAMCKSAEWPQSPSTCIIPAKISTDDQAEIAKVV